MRSFPAGNDEESLKPIRACHPWQNAASGVSVGLDVGVPVVCGYDIAGTQLVLVYDYRVRSLPVLRGRLAGHPLEQLDPLRFPGPGRAAVISCARCPWRCSASHGVARLPGVQHGAVAFDVHGDGVSVACP